MPSTENVNPPYDQALDITRDRCPMTYVRVRLALDRMQSDQVLLVQLTGEEPLRNVPRSAIEQGHTILSSELDAAGITRLWLRKK